MLWQFDRIEEAKRFEFPTKCLKFRNTFCRSFNRLYKMGAVLPERTIARPRQCRGRDAYLHRLVQQPSPPRPDRTRTRPHDTSRPHDRPPPFDHLRRSGGDTNHRVMCPGRFTGSQLGEKRRHRHPHHLPDGAVGLRPPDRQSYTPLHRAERRRATNTCS